MITGLDEQIQFKDWQEELKNGFRDSASLLRFLELPSQLEVKHPFPMRVPIAFAKKMIKGNPDDPLLKQVLTTSQELVHLHGYTVDPLEEEKQSPLPGLLHKYYGRILILPTTTCAINCRYCFRKHFPYNEHRLSEDDWQRLLAYIERHDELSEVILSGGDPLLMPDKALLSRLEALSEISHIKRIRFHTRIPIVLPSRISKAFTEWCEAASQQIVVVTHCNHPNELGEDVYGALSALRAARVTLLNQAVLLLDINDNIITLEELSHKLFDYGVLPYYLHLPDKVAGTHHFDVTEEVAKTLIRQLQAKLPGYLVPRLAVEHPFAKSKTHLV